MHSEQQYTILFLDDDTNVLRSIKRLFIGRKHKLVIVDDGQKALDFMQQNIVHVVVSDISMPNMSGDVFLEKVALAFPETQRIVLSGLADSDTILRLVNNGKIQRFIQKPWDNESLLETVEESIDKLRLKQKYHSLQSQLEEQNKRLKVLNDNLESRVELRTLQVKTSLKQAKQGAHVIKKVLLNTFTSVAFIDPTRGQQVSNLAEKVAAVLKLDVKTTSDISFAALIYEIGMLPLGEKIYQQPFTKLSPGDQESFLSQAQHTKFMLSSANQLHEIKEYILKQFEYVNGKGFPDQLVSDDIPLGAQVIAVCRDYFMYTNGLYDSNAYNSTVALGKIKNFVGIKYANDAVIALSTVLKNENALQNKKNDCITASDLKVGMVLLNSIYNDKDILVMPEGQVFDAKSIAKLQKIETDAQSSLVISIK